MPNQLYPVQPKTADEQFVVDLLRRAAASLPEHPQAFIAGGWTRDKMLGLDEQIQDVDVMVYKTTGPKFANAVAKVMGMDPSTIVEYNREVSKKVETAHMNIQLPSGVMGEFDFAMARTETYNERSRVPETVNPGTPEEDATRRDLTINSLFYDVNTGKVEDFTGQGVSDLRDGIVRAPGTPFVRFMEDPIRVMRAIRFASKYGFKIDPETYKAMQDPTVLRELLYGEKSAKEMIGKEFIKIMQSPGAVGGVRLMQDLGVFQSLINDSSKGYKSSFKNESGQQLPYEGNLAPWNMSQNNAHHKMTLDEHTLKVLQNSLALYTNDTPEKQLISRLTALFHDFGKMFKGIQGTTPYGSTSFHGHEEESSILTEAFLKYLRLDSYIPKVQPLVKHHMRPHALVEDSGPKAVRKLLRDLADDGAHWVDLLNQAEADATAKGEVLGDEERQYVEKMNSFRSTIQAIEQEMATKSVNLQKPILNGNELMQIFNNPHPGKWIGDISAWLKDLMLGNVNLTKDEAIQKVKENFPQYIIQQNKTASIASDVLLNKRQEQVDAVIKTEPYRAMTLAVSLWKSHPDDERTLLMCVKTAMAAKSLSGQSVYSEEIYEAARKLADDRIFNPEIIGSFIGYKTLMGKDLTEEDIASLKRATTMDRGITNKIANLVCSIGGNSQWIKLWTSIQNDENRAIIKETSTKLHGS